MRWFSSSPSPRLAIISLQRISNEKYIPLSQVSPARAFDARTEYSSFDFQEQQHIALQGNALPKYKSMSFDLALSETSMPIHSVTKAGSSGNDSLLGTNNDDTIWGYGGRDQIDGLDGTDTLYGGDDGDYVAGSQGNDKLYGDNGDDIIFGGAGTDTIELAQPWSGDTPDFSWLHMTSGSYSVNGDTISLSGGAEGYIILDDGTFCSFTNLEQIHLV